MYIRQPRVPLLGHLCFALSSQVATSSSSSTRAASTRARCSCAARRSAPTRPSTGSCRACRTARWACSRTRRTAAVARRQEATSRTSRLLRGRWSRHPYCPSRTATANDTTGVFGCSSLVGSCFSPSYRKLFCCKVFVFTGYAF